MPAPLLSPDRVAAFPARSFDAIVIGAGVAGLTFALHLPADWRVLLLTKGDLGESNTRYAQGGISAAIGDDDSPRLHEADTLVAGAALCDPAAVRKLVDGAPQAVDWLIEIGAEFDRDAGGSILLGREAAHSRRRVLHAGGDATGHEVERALVAAARRNPNIEVWEHAAALDLLAADGSITGAVIEDGRGVRWKCQATVTAIAAGGAGQLWEVTSNPGGATADGLAMAIRAGVTVADCEFVQFHPTVLALDGWEAFLVSEAVRGEGAYLRDDAGERFMVSQHELAELAPRDVVARGIHRQLIAGQGAFLDVRHLDADSIRQRFPTIAQELARRGLDLATDSIPVSPAAHYFMGGVVAAPDGRTSHPGLLALGEAACTGIHGANRLASNSLLEGLVFGRIAAEQVAPGQSTAAGDDTPPSLPEPNAPGDLDPARTAALRRRIKTTMSAFVGVERSADGFRTGLAEFDLIGDDVAALGESLPEITVRNMLTAARAIAGAALHRQESRGGHSRADFPATDPLLDYRHSLLENTGAWSYGALAPSLTPRRLLPAYVSAMQRFWERSDYDKGIITNPFGFDDAAGERGLARTRGIVERLGNPLVNLPVIHVAGSKGKGSTTACLASSLTAAGRRTGRYTSPHLHSFRERIAIDGDPMSEADFAVAFDRALAAAERLEREEPALGRVTAFELMTAMAFDHFARAGCDIAVIETGLGGRWDASNIVDPLVSVIALIDLEHTEILGDSLAKIAREKAGIIKPGRPVVTLAQAPEVIEVFRSAAAERHAPLAIEGRDWQITDDSGAAVYKDSAGRIGPFRSGLRGAHQARNAGLAIAALRQVPGLDLPESAIVAGLANAWLPGRHEIVPGHPVIVIDGAHSPASARALAATIRRDFPDANPQHLALVFSMLKDKDAVAFLQEIATVARNVTLVELNSPRAMPIPELERAVAIAGVQVDSAPDVASAIDRHRTAGIAGIIVAGSLTLAAEARETLGLAEPEVIPRALKKA